MVIPRSRCPAVMEGKHFPKILLSSNSKDLPSQLLERFSTLHTMQVTPVESMFGPCLLPQTLMDAISFIALKCTDERNSHYVFKVDALARSHGLGWLRLVQMTSGPQKQNVDTYIKGGESNFRATCPVHKEEQLLVWYDGQISMVGQDELRDGTNWKNGMTPKHLKQGTNFHSLARDMERERMEQVVEEGRKSVLLEKTNCQDGSNNLCKREEERKMDVVPVNKGGGCRLAQQEHSAFTEVRRVRSLHGANETVKDTIGSAFSPVPSSRGFKMSAFSRPSKSLRVDVSNSCDKIHGMTGVSVTHGFSVSPEYPSLHDSLTTSVIPVEVCSKPGVASDSQQRLPPTFTPLGATAQNWCAKCKLSFRMTSDLVLHMRLRHKREAGGETHRRKRREPQLSCPVCNAYFRERHHLSRHMTSHC